MLLQGINFDNLNKNHKVLSQLTKEGFRFRFKHEWNNSKPFMPCNKFNIYYEKFKVLNADKDLSRRFEGRGTNFTYYNKYELEDIVENTFYILKMWNEDYLYLFDSYLRYIKNNTIFNIDLDYGVRLTKVLDGEEISFNELFDRCGSMRNWTKIPSSNIASFQRDLAFDQKLFKNREYLKKAVSLYKGGDVVTMSRLGLSDRGSLWRNIEGLIKDLNKFTEMPQRKDALYTISECFRYFDFINYKPSVSEVQSQVGGSKRMIKLAIKYFYDKNKVLYEEGSKEIIDNVEVKINNYLDYNYEMIKNGDTLRLILTEKTQ